MKKLIWVFMCIFMLFSLSNLVNAQSAAGMERMRIGLGVAIGKEILPIDIYDSSIMLQTVDFPDIYVPIQVSPGLRIEPYIGYWRYSYTNKCPSYTSKYKYSIMNIGVGVFLTTWCGPVDLYYGGRIGMRKISQSSTYTNASTSESKYKQTNWAYGPAVGGEYFFTNNLSIGGEVQFNYIKVGDWERSDGDNNHEDECEESTSILATKVLLTVRWFYGCK